jgi:hypothetical protein
MLTLSQLEELLCHYFIEIYADRPHTTLKKSPRQMWLERVKLDGIERINDMATFQLSFGTVVRNKQLTREGVKHRGLVYRSPEEARLLSDGLGRQRKRGIRKGAISIKVKEYPEDVSRIGVYDETYSTYVDFVCEMKKYPVGLTIHQNDLIKKSFGGGENYKVSEEELCIRREHFRERIRSMIPASNITNRKRIARAEPPPLGKSQEVSMAISESPGFGNPDDTEFEIAVSPHDNRTDGGFVEPSRARGSKPTAANRGKKASPAPASQPTKAEVVASEESKPFAAYDIDALLSEAEVLEGTK